jgi:hypothetical protein
MFLSVYEEYTGKFLVSLGLVWEMEESSGWKRIEGDFGKF